MQAFAGRRGHFLLESGHHSDLWLDLEHLCKQPALIKPPCVELADRLRPLAIEVVCGPLVEGAFIGLLVAAELQIEFCYSERYARASEDGLFPAGYRLPKAVRASVRQRRIAIVNDVINAGSAVRGTFDDLVSCGAVVIAMGTLLTLGSAAREFAISRNVVLESLSAQTNTLWSPAECPLCAAGVPLEDVAGFGKTLAITERRGSAT